MRGAFNSHRQYWGTFCDILPPRHYPSALSSPLCLSFYVLKLNSVTSFLLFYFIFFMSEVLACMHCKISKLQLLFVLRGPWGQCAKKLYLYTYLLSSVQLIQQWHLLRSTMLCYMSHIIHTNIARLYVYNWFLNHYLLKAATIYYPIRLLAEKILL